MNNELLLPITKHTDIPSEPTRTRPQETLQFKMHKQLELFSFNPAKGLSDEEKWMLAVTSFEATISIFKITDGNNSFSFTTPG